MAWEETVLKCYTGTTLQFRVDNLNELFVRAVRSLPYTSLAIANEAEASLKELQTEERMQIGRNLDLKRTESPAAVKA